MFLAVARAGSTLAASRELGMSQNTVARRIDELESGLGLELFERNTRGFRLTAQGRALIEPAEEVERAAGGFLGAADALRPGRGTPIRLTGAESTFTEDFSEWLARFLDANPGVQIDLLSTDARVDLMAGEADVALRVAMAVDDDRLICQRSGGIAIAFYASKTYAKKHTLPRSYAEVRDHPLIVDGAPFLRAMFPALDDHPRIASRGGTLRAVVTAIRSGLGVGAVPVQVACDTPGLVCCFPPDESQVVPVWLVTSPAAHKRPEVRRLTAFLGDELRAFYRDGL